MDVKIKRVYSPTIESDGFRVLVDRLWPRGVAKEAAHIDLWAKGVAPSTELRRAWHADVEGHSPEHFQAFRSSYLDELASGDASTALDELVALAEQHPHVTLVYGAKDEQTNHAVVLRDAVIARASRSKS